MRIVFWVVTFIGLALALFGQFVFSVPMIPDVIGSVLDDWYLDRTIRAVLLGLAAGLVGGWLVRRRLLYTPGESGRTYLDRVAGRGLLTQLVAVLLLLAYVWWAASRATFIPLNPWDRFLEVLLAGKALGVLGAVIFSAGIGFAVMTRSLRWGGRFALLGPNLLPTLTGKV